MAADDMAEERAEGLCKRRIGRDGLGSSGQRMAQTRKPEVDGREEGGRKGAGARGVACIVRSPYLAMVEFKLADAFYGDFLTCSFVECLVYV